MHVGSKTPWIDDPEEAAKILISETLGIKKDENHDCRTPKEFSTSFLCAKN